MTNGFFTNGASGDGGLTPTVPMGLGCWRVPDGRRGYSP